MKIAINGADREIEVKKMTRGIEKGFNKRLLGDSVADSKGEVQVKPGNIFDAQDWKMSELTGLTIEEIDTLSKTDYEAIEKAIEETP